MTNDQDTVRQLVAYHDRLSVPSFDVEADVVRGRRFLRRRRILTATGAAAVALAIAGTVGVLAPRAGDGDALPALPTPTTTPTPEVTPTVTPSASVTATPTAAPTAVVTPTATPTATPTRTGEPEPSSTPTPTPSRSVTPTPTSTGSTTFPWSSPVIVGGVSYRARWIKATEGDYIGFKAELQADRKLLYTRYDPNGEYGLSIRRDPRVVIGSFIGPLDDVVSENGEPVIGEEFDSITLRLPEADPYTSPTMTFTIIRLPRAATATASGAVASMVVRNIDGTVVNLCEGFCGPS